MAYDEPSQAFQGHGIDLRGQLGPSHAHLDLSDRRLDGASFLFGPAVEKRQAAWPYPSSDSVILSIELKPTGSECLNRETYPGKIGLNA